MHPQKPLMHKFQFVVQMRSDLWGRQYIFRYQKRFCILTAHTKRRFYWVNICKTIYIYIYIIRTYEIIG